MVMGYQAYAGNGLLDGITTGVGLRKAYDDMKRQQQLQERSDNFGTALSNYYSAQDDAGRQAALQEMAKNDPASTLTFQKNNKDSSFGVGTAKGEYLQIQALLNDPLTPETMKENLKRRASVLEKIPDIAYSNAYAGRMGTLQADLGLGGQVEAEKERGKKEVELQYNPQIEQSKEVAKGQAKNELGKIAIEEQMPRVIKAAENVSNMTDEGVGPIEGRLTPLGVLSSGAEQNYENVMEMNRAMNSMIRQKLSAMGITGREMDTEREAARNLYLLNPTDPKGIREQKINNFFNNFLQMDVPQNNVGASLVSKYGLEE